MALPLNCGENLALVVSRSHQRLLGSKINLGAFFVSIALGVVWLISQSGSVVYPDGGAVVVVPHSEKLFGLSGAGVGVSQQTMRTDVVIKKRAEPEWKRYLTKRDELKAPLEKNRHYYKKSSSEIDRKTLRDISVYYGLPTELLYYQNYMESHGRCLNVASKKGAIGCFQFLEATAKEFGLITDSADYRSYGAASADAAARYMLWLAIVMYGDKANLGDWEQLRHVLAAYNAGYAVVNKTGTPQIPTYVETVNYVTNIESLVKGDAVIVQPGDTLEQVSERAGVSVDTLLRSNVSITGPKELRTGMILLLPDSYGMSKVVVRPGMNLYNIHRRTGVSLEQLSLANGLGSDKTIQTGTVLLIPSV